MKVSLKIAITFLLTAICFQSFAQMTPRQARNLDAFATLYGYVRYFHPSDESFELNQAKFAAYGALSVLNSRNDSELIRNLSMMFKPIAPTVRIFNTLDHLSVNRKDLTPLNASLYNTVYWQHLGMNPFNDDKLFSSERVNRPALTKHKGYLTVPITDTLNLESFVGKRFEISFTARTTAVNSKEEKYRVTANQGYLTDIKDVFSNNNIQNDIVSSAPNRYRFSGTIREEQSHAVWTISFKSIFIFQLIASSFGCMTAVNP